MLLVKSKKEKRKKKKKKKKKTKQNKKAMAEAATAIIPTNIKAKEPEGQEESSMRPGTKRYLKKKMEAEKEDELM